MTTFSTSFPSQVHFSYLTTTWEFWYDINSSVTLSDPWIILLKQEGECHIMPTVLSQLFHKPNPLLSKLDLQKFNLCCIYLQVITLSDITTSSGMVINCHFWKGPLSSWKSSLNWPNWICLSSTCCGILHKAPNLIFTDSMKSWFESCVCGLYWAYVSVLPLSYCPSLCTFW